MPQLELGKQLEERFAEKFLGSRDDRDEISYWVDPSVWLEAAAFIKAETPFSVLEDLTAVDYLDRPHRFDLSIIVMSLEQRSSVRIKTMLHEDQPVESLASVWAGAGWYDATPPRCWKACSQARRAATSPRPSPGWG